MKWKVVHGDCLSVLGRLRSNSVDAWITDPPAGIAFMGKTWDKGTKLGVSGGVAMPLVAAFSRNPCCRRCGGRRRAGPKTKGCECESPSWDTRDRVAAERENFIAFVMAVAEEALRVLKPGAHGLVWSLPRTRHWTAMALELAGFEIRDDIAHFFSQGFPKNHDIAKGVQKLQGVKPIGERAPSLGMANNPQWNALNRQLVMPEPEGDAERFVGWGTALKPAREDWILVRKPLESSVARNALKYGTGGINIDGARILAGGPSPSVARRESAKRSGNAPGKPGREGFKDRTSPERYTEQRGGESLGRWPSHVLLSHGPDCRLVGTREVTTGTAVRRNGKGGKFFGGIDPDRMKLPGPAPDATHGVGGKETIGAWDCSDDCPVRIVDSQSGTSKAKAGRRGKRGGSPIHGSPTIGSPEQEGTWPDDPGGGASRFYQTFECSDDCPVRIVDSQSGFTQSRRGRPRAGVKGDGWNMRATGTEHEDSGGASRFYRVFYTAKPARSEKEAGCEDLATKTAAELTGRKAGSAGLVMKHDDGTEKANPYAGTSGQTPRGNTHPCLRPGSLVLTDRGWLSIESVRAGDAVLSATGYGEVVEVSHHHCSGPLFGIEVNGQRVEATGNHPFLVLRDGLVQWIEARLLRAGDETLTPLFGRNTPGTVKPWESADRRAGTRVATGPQPRRAITGSHTKDASAWSMTSSGRRPMGLSQKGSGSTTRTKTSKIIACRTSCLSMPLLTSGCTPVARYETESGGSHAGCAVCSSPSRPNTGTSPRRGGSRREDVSHVISQSSSETSSFAAHRIDRVELVSYEGEVWNLTVLGSPTFQTTVGMSHNTVKPVKLMRYLVRLITPRGGLVLDTFCGSGTTGVAAILEGMRFLGIEKDEEGEGYVETARARCAHAAESTQPRSRVKLVLHWSGSEDSWTPPEGDECGWCGADLCGCCPECGNVIEHRYGCSLENR